MRYCRFCGTKVEDEVIICPSCGKAIPPLDRSPHVTTFIQEENTARVVPQNKNAHLNEEIVPNSTAINSISSVSAGESVKSKTTAGQRRWIVGILVVAAVFLGYSVIKANQCKVEGCTNSVVKGFDYCSEHKCSISDCGSLASTGSMCTRHYNQMMDYLIESSVSARDLKISGVSVKTNSVSTVAEGKITNNSNVTVQFVQIRGVFKDRSGNILDTDWTYAVGSEGLAPGETKKWSMYVDKNYSIKSCTAEVYDYDVVK